MSLFKLDKELTKLDKNHKFIRNLSLLYAALYCVGSLIMNSFDDEKELLKQRIMKREQEQVNELYNQFDGLHETDEFIVEETKRIREENIQQEAETITEYYEKSKEIVDQTVYIDTNLLVTDARIDNCDKNYGEAIDEIAPRFGVSPNIIRAIATQEGGGVLENVMQVASGWKYQKISYHDYILNKDMKLCVCNESKITDDCIYISTSDPYWSVWIGSCLVQAGIQYNNGHLFSAFSHYNRGDATPLVNKVAVNEGLTREEYLDDKYNAAIQYYEYNCYILYCLQFMDDNPIEYTYYDKDNDKYEYVVIYPEFKNRDITDVIQDEIGDEPTCEFEENEELLELESRQLAYAISRRSKK